jgi:Uma2 family endonuclease
MVMVEEAYLPVTLFAPGLTDEAFQNFCEQYEDYQLEYSAEGELLIMPPTDAETGGRNARLIEQLSAWSRRQGKGLATDSSTGFVLVNGSRRSPDAAWISRSRLQVAPRCPEFLIELLSPSDRIKKAHDKMREWVDNGVQLGWLIDPFARTVTIYRSGQPSERLTEPGQVRGDGSVEGFVLDLDGVWS